MLALHRSATYTHEILAFIVHLLTDCQFTFDYIQTFSP